MMLLERLRQHKNTTTMKFRNVIAMSGPYDIARHFQFEASRQVENLSPMMPACGGKHLFYSHSPFLQLAHYASLCSQERLRMISSSFPRLVFLHGLDDGTVPAESSQRAARQLREVGLDCREHYYPGLDHPDTVMETMFGGNVQDAVFDWIEEAKVKPEVLAQGTN